MIDRSDSAGRSRLAIRRGALLLLLSAAAAGCDNIDWGGLDVAIIPPPPKATTNPEQALDGEVDRLPEGPVLFYAQRTPGASTATLIPVFEIGEDSLIATEANRDAERYANRFVADFMRQGSEFVLFSNGVRAGQLVIQSAEPVPGGRCGPTPQATGSLELVAGADSITEFIALSRLNAPQVARRLDERIMPTARMEYMTQILAEQMLRARRAQLPGSWQRAMAQVTAFPVSGAQNPGLAATYLVGDTLGPGPAGPGYSLLFLAVPSSAQVGWDTVFVEFTDYPTSGKAAPRLVDYLDWNRDDQVELLMRVYSADDSWFEAISRDESGGWRRTFRGRCEIIARPAQPAMPAGDSVAPEGARGGTAVAPPDTLGGT